VSTWFWNPLPEVTHLIILETPRVVLRHLVLSDLADLYSLYKDPGIRRYFPEGTLTLEETKEELDWFLGGHPKHPELGLWATVLKENGTFIGRCGLLPWTIEEQYEVEVAYMLGKPWWGQGLATEAAGGIARHAFDNLKLTRLIALIDENNERSIKVAERIGMAFEKQVDDGKGPAMMYSMCAPP
jgi:RimJ/RimL family protein N-acetyltransferase